MQNYVLQAVQSLQSEALYKLCKALANLRVPKQTLRSQTEGYQSKALVRKAKLWFAKQSFGSQSKALVRKAKLWFAKQSFGSQTPVFVRGAKVTKAL